MFEALAHLKLMLDAHAAGAQLDAQLVDADRVRIGIDATFPQTPTQKQLHFKHLEVNVLNDSFHPIV